MSLLVGQCLEVVRLMKKKINLIITEEKIKLNHKVPKDIPVIIHNGRYSFYN